MDAEPEEDVVPEMRMRCERRDHDLAPAASSSCRHTHFDKTQRGFVAVAVFPQEDR
jgi:hypothetical protein